MVESIRERIKELEGEKIGIEGKLKERVENQETIICAEENREIKFCPRIIEEGSASKEGNLKRLATIEIYPDSYSDCFHVECPKYTPSSELVRAVHRIEGAIEKGYIEKEERSKYIKALDKSS